MHCQQDGHGLEAEVGHQECPRGVAHWLLQQAYLFNHAERVVVEEPDEAHQSYDHELITEEPKIHYIMIKGPRQRVFVGISAINVESQSVLKVLFIQNNPQDFLMVVDAEKLIIFGIQWQLSKGHTLMCLLPPRGHQGVSFELLILSTGPVPQRDLAIICVPEKQRPIQEDAASLYIILFEVLDHYVAPLEAHAEHEIIAYQAVIMLEDHVNLLFEAAH